MRAEFVPKNKSREKTIVIVKALREIEARDGIIRPQAVVEAATPEGSPLHQFFEWDNTKAAVAHREQQARQLIRSVVIRDAESTSPTTVRAYVNVKVTDEDDDDDVNIPSTQGYISTQKLENAPGLQAQTLRYARQQLLTWRAKFGAMKEFLAISKAIDNEFGEGEKKAA